MADDDLILDIGPKTAALYSALAREGRTIVWNWPVGVFEFGALRRGHTRSRRGGGAVQWFFYCRGGDNAWLQLLSFGSRTRCPTLDGGGAFLEFLEGKSLPAVAMLEHAQREGLSMPRRNKNCCDPGSPRRGPFPARAHDDAGLTL